MAKKTNKLSVHLTDVEQVWGIVYLLFTTFALPYLLGLLNSLLPAPMGDAWYNFLYFTLNFLFIIWIFHGFFKRSIIYAGKHFWRFLLAVLGGTAAYWLLSWGLAQLLRWLFPAYENLNDINIIAMAHSNFFIMFIGTVIFVPVAEESLHRALVFGSLYPKNHVLAYVLSAVIFAAVHIINYITAYPLPHLLLAFVQYIPAGLVLAAAYRLSGSIFAPMLIHALINAIGLLTSR